MPDRQGQDRTRLHKILSLGASQPGRLPHGEVVLVDREGEGRRPGGDNVDAVQSVVTVRRGRDFEEISPTSLTSTVVIRDALRGLIVARRGSRGSTKRSSASHVTLTMGEVYGWGNEGKERT